MCDAQRRLRTSSEAYLIAIYVYSRRFSMFTVGRNWFNPRQLSVDCLQSSSDNEYRTRSLIQIDVAYPGSSFVPGGSLVTVLKQLLIPEHTRTSVNLRHGEAIAVYSAVRCEYCHIGYQSKRNRLFNSKSTIQRGNTRGLGGPIRLHHNGREWKFSVSFRV